MFVPAPLFPGARVALVGPSSAVSEERLRRADALVSALGLKPVYYPSCLYQSRDGYLAATDAQRAQDIMRAFESDAIDGIWCLRGGYGAHRILPLLDAAVIRKHRKWFGGYSDVTALHTFLNQKCGLETYHTIMPATDWDVGRLFPRSAEKGALWRPFRGAGRPRGLCARRRWCRAWRGGRCAAATSPCWRPPWARRGRSTRAGRSSSSKT